MSGVIEGWRLVKQQAREAVAGWRVVVQMDREWLVGCCAARQRDMGGLRVGVGGNGSNTHMCAGGKRSGTEETTQGSLACVVAGIT